MTPTRGTYMHVGLILLGLTLVGVGIYLFFGVDNTNTIATIGGGLASLLGVGLAIYAIFQTRGSENDGSESVNPLVRQKQRGGKNSTNLQAGRDIKMGDKNQFGKKSA